MSINGAYDKNNFANAKVDSFSPGNNIEKLKKVEFNPNLKSNFDEIGSLPKNIVIKHEKNVDNILKIVNVTVDESLNIETIVKFDQREIIDGEKKISDKLMGIKLQFNGLCELICNKILIDDSLGTGDGDFWKRELTADELNKEKIVKSHLLNVYSVFNKMAAFLLGIYPDNILSIRKQLNLVKNNKVNEKILFNGLKKINSGTTLKLEIFSKSNNSFSGHSLLVKKTGENQYIFFDPNSGEHRNLTQVALVQKINDQIAKHDGTDIFFTKGEAYIKRLISKNIIKKFNETFK